MASSIMNAENIFYQYDYVLFGFVFISAVLLLFEASINTRAFGIFGLFILGLLGAGKTLYESYYYIIAIFSTYIYVPVASVILVRGAKKHSRISGRIGILLTMILVFLAAVVGYDHYQDSRTKDLLGKCQETLSVMWNAQYYYHSEHGKYAGDFSTLSEFAVARCRNAESFFCGFPESLDEESNCMTISFSFFPDGDFKIEATIADRTECYICVTPDGMNRKERSDCEDKSKDKCVRNK